MTNLLSVDNLSLWMNRMSHLPYHDESHVALATLGDLRDDKNKVPLMKRLGAATKAGVQSFAKVNEQTRKTSTSNL
ncbi:unnamed protein product [Pseudo-nitzschia multistriata]|uniref:Uncharacterized protein n=1 Tax=Pseudo-nitzschia multistriata TaxID=183589 RepID=A0A448ZEB7_9STRA|nr:unnamed protein product [Pseudo-nitzschia multistriata]